MSLDTRFKNAMFSAVYYNNIVIFALLADLADTRGIDLKNILQETYKEPRTLFDDVKSSDMCMLLIEVYDFDVDKKEAIISFSRSNLIDPLRYMLAHNAPVDALSDNGNTPLTFAVLRDNYAMVKLLLEYNADTKKVDIQKQSFTLVYIKII